MTTLESIRVTRAGPVTTVTITRPEVHNAFNDQVNIQMKEAFDAIAGDAATRVVVLAGEGRSFSAGADLEWMRRTADYTEAENRRDGATLAAMFRAIAECPHPVVARVQGYVLGGGVGLVAAADIAIAADSAQFGFSEVRLGLAPATIAPFIVEKIGPGWTRALFLSGERFDTARAHAIGLVHQVAPEAELDAAVAATVNALLAGGPAAQAACKALVRQVLRTADPVALDRYTVGVIAAARAGVEGREGVRAFLEKRRPVWAAEGDR